MKTLAILVGPILVLALFLPSAILAGGPPRPSPVGAILTGAAVAGAAAHVIHGPPPPPPGTRPPPPPAVPIRPPMAGPPDLLPPGFPSPELTSLENTTLKISRMGEVIYSTHYYGSPIIVMLDDGRRLYQPPIHGHVAFIQVWSSVHKEWISIKEHPSIW